VETYAELVRLADRFFGLKERELAKAAEVKTHMGPFSRPENLAKFLEIGEPEIFEATKGRDDDDDEPLGLEVS